MIDRGKSWACNTQAFGTTEKRFNSQAIKVPGPGTYKTERHKKMAQNFVVKRVRG